MSKVNLSEAARMVPVSRSTFNRHLKIGKVSKSFNDQGKPCVDVSELQRVYGKLSHDTVSKNIPIKHNDTPDMSHQNALLKIELEATKKLLEKAELNERKWHEEANDWKKQAQSLITDQRSKSEQSSKKKWFQLLFN